MKIRFATQDDKDHILKLLEELIQEAKRQGASPPKYQGDLKAKEALFKEVMDRKDVFFFVAEENGKLVGLLEVFVVPIVRRGYRQAVIESLVVTNDMRNKGVGSSLMKKVKEFCKANNIHVLKLTSALVNANAHRFYERHGGKFAEKLFKFELE